MHYNGAPRDVIHRQIVKAIPINLNEMMKKKRLRCFMQMTFFFPDLIHVHDDHFYTKFINWPYNLINGMYDRED